MWPSAQASTSEVYGDPTISPQPEEYWGNVNCNGVRSCYDEGKRAAETLCFDYHRQNGVDIRVVRIFNTYGPGMHPYDGRVVSNFLVQVGHETTEPFHVCSERSGWLLRAGPQRRGHHCVRRGRADPVILLCASRPKLGPSSRPNSSEIVHDA